VFVVLTVIYVGSGILIRLGGIVRRRLRHAPPSAQAEQQIG
jgi:hypothetical protein